MPRMRGRVVADQLRTLAFMIERGQADGYVEVSFGDDFDPMERLDAFDFGSSRSRLRSSHDDVRIEIQVDPSWREWVQYIQERGAAARQSSAEEADLAYRQFSSPRAPRPDCGPAVDLFVQMMKVIIKAWTMDDASKRFGMLELD